jgi:hypothetical protein
MNPLKHPRSWGRWAPVAAALLGSAYLAAPAGAQAPAPAPAVPFVAIGANTSEVLGEEFNPGTVTVERNGALLSTGTFVDSTEPGRTIFTVNSTEIAGLGLPVGCWSGFTPQILPGDVVTVGTEAPVTIPNLSVKQPVLEGDTVVVHGTASNIPAGWGVSAQIFPAGGGKFAGGVGSSGGAFLDSGIPRGFGATFSFDPGSTTRWTARFNALGAQTAIAAAGDAVVEAATPDVVGAGTLFAVDWAANATPVGQANCPAYAPDEARSASRSLINVANAGNDLTISGVAHPGASTTGITLTDVNGNIVTAPAIGGTAWTANVPAASLASLADGAISIAPNLATFGKGGAVDGLVRKDTTAPSAVTASVAAGTYPSTQSVEFSSDDGAIRYTTDGSDPTANSTRYSKAISVGTTQTIKAIAIDAAGNSSPVSAFGYTIAAPKAAPAPAPQIVPSVKAPKLKLDALTVGSRYSLRSVRRNGLRAVIFAPTGAKVVKVRLLRNGHVITRTTRVVRGDGVMTVTLPSTKKGRAKLRRGTYKLQVTPGSSPSNYGATTTRTIRIR